MVTAAEPSIDREVWFVLAIGPYFNAGALVVKVMSRTFHTQDGPAPWDPDQTARRVVERILLAVLPEEERTAIASGGSPRTANGRLIQELPASPGLDRTEALVQI